jgi:hypothetical protein
MASVVAGVFFPYGPNQQAAGYLVAGPSYTNPGGTALHKNGFPVLFPTSQTVTYLFSPGDYLAPAVAPVNFFYATGQPQDISNFLPGDCYVDTMFTNAFTNLSASFANVKLWQFQTNNDFKLVGNLLASPVAQQSTATTLNGGSDQIIQTAITNAGPNGEIILSGNFVCSNWIRNLTKYSITLRFSNPTFIFGPSVGASVGQVIRQRGTRNKLVDSPADFRGAIEGSSLAAI